MIFEIIFGVAAARDSRGVAPTVPISEISAFEKATIPTNRRSPRKSLKHEAASYGELPLEKSSPEP